MHRLVHCFRKRLVHCFRKRLVRRLRHRAASAGEGQQHGPRVKRVDGHAVENVEAPGIDHVDSGARCQVQAPGAEKSLRLLMIPSEELEEVGALDASAGVRPLSLLASLACHHKGLLAGHPGGHSLSSEPHDGGRGFRGVSPMKYIPHVHKTGVHLGLQTRSQHPESVQFSDAIRLQPEK